uniref:DNA methyltransferase n=2 Tax=unclassified Caudoviricetes TaxID=2788787 RepID=A0AB39ABW8_9CAUD
MKKAIFLYDYTGIMAKPWADNGYQCWLFDGQHPSGITQDGNILKAGMWFDAYNTHQHVNTIIEMVGDGVEIVFGFPECTDMAVSGAAHFERKRQANQAFQAEACELARLVMYVGNAIGCKWAAENPVSVLSSLWRKSDFQFHPYEYGGYLPENDVHPLYPEYLPPRDAYGKKTCIWHGNWFIEPERKPVKIVNSVGQGQSDAHNKLGGKSQKTKNIRSATPRGFAEAVFKFNHSLGK